eukprot:TRINITY_DN162_c0_g1_i10.p1 TRINITY_DN162_c0_g1~~TRINITY_DN162_c0_g1_i10.p1  ORF type:complete len:772 (-),score=151.26 TRINITY_DN162_c0_g1_i10:522-2837(-)
MSTEKRENKEHDMVMKLIDDNPDNIESILAEAKKNNLNISRSISAPPPGFSQDVNPEEEVSADDVRYDPAYYVYYQSQKDPRLPKPLYKPPPGIVSTLDLFDDKNLKRIFTNTGKPEKLDRNTFNENIHIHDDTMEQISSGFDNLGINAEAKVQNFGGRGNDQNHGGMNQGFQNTNQMYDNQFSGGPPKSGTSYQKFHQHEYGSHGGHGGHGGHTSQSGHGGHGPHGGHTAHGTQYQNQNQRGGYNNYGGNRVNQGGQYNNQYENMRGQNNMLGINPQMNMVNPYTMNQQFYPQGYQEQFRYGNNNTMGKVSQLHPHPWQLALIQQTQGYFDNFGYGNNSGNMMMYPNTQNQMYMGNNMQYNNSQFYQGGGMDYNNYSNFNYHQPKPNPRTNNMGTFDQGYQNQSRKLNIREMLPTIYETCKDQNGSRSIQQEFENASDEDKQLIFDGIQPKINNLIEDVFGNYVIQKILEKGKDTHKRQIFECMKGKIYELSVHTYGCRVVQKALEEFKNMQDLQSEILKELKSKVLDCIIDQNGNHVLQKCIECVHSSKLNFIIDEVTANINDLSFHAYGCRVIQRILEYIPTEKTTIILQKLMQDCKKLCECQFGNYLMQHVIEKGPPKEKDQLLAVTCENFVELSLNKFASNVTEKSIIFSSHEYRKSVLNQLLKPSSNNELGLIRLMKDAYGNYVAQRLIEYSDAGMRKMIQQKIQNDINELKKSQYGKHVLAFLEKAVESSSRKMQNLSNDLIIDFDLVVLALFIHSKQFIYKRL